MTPPEAAWNPYRPRLLRIVARRDETPDTRTLTLEPLDSGADGRAVAPPLRWQPGQFGEFSVFGAGEAVFALANAPSAPDQQEGDGRLAIQCTFRAVGKVTEALRGLAVGELLGFRGPYGSHFPLPEWRGRHVAFLGGGIGMAALRAALQAVLARRSEFGDVLVLNAARTPADMVYQDEMPDWAKTEGVRVIRAVDPGGETPSWDGTVGLLPDVYEKTELAAEGRVVVACGPPVMLRFLFSTLERMGYSPEQVFTTLENKMKCGIGLCGRCNVGPFFVCRDGPVLTWATLRTLPADL